MEKLPGRLLRERRLHHGVSQARLAVRAGTTQSAISRIERDRISPSVGKLRELLHLLGDDLRLEASPRDFGIDPTQVVERRRLAPEQRLEYATDIAEFVVRHRGTAQAGSATRDITG